MARRRYAVGAFQETGPQHGPGVLSSVSVDLEATRAHPNPGAPRYSQPLYGIVRGRVMGRFEPPAADADLLLRLRYRDEGEDWSRYQSHRLRSFFSRRHAAM